MMMTERSIKILVPEFQNAVYVALYSLKVLNKVLLHQLVNYNMHQLILGIMRIEWYMCFVFVFLLLFYKYNT